MRIHVGDVVAMNFIDCLLLEKDVRTLLEDMTTIGRTQLGYTSLEIMFEWTSIQQIRIINVNVCLVEEKEIKRNCFSFTPPDGCSSGTWADLIFTRLRSTVLAGNRFVIEDVDDARTSGVTRFGLKLIRK